MREKLLLIILIFLTGCVSNSSSDNGKNNKINNIMFKAEKGYFKVWDGAAYKTIFLKGINLGVGIPGRYPGELAVSSEQYDRWLNDIYATGANNIRVYTLHFPRFYESLNKFNLAHKERPLYLFQGIWLDEVESLDLYSMTFYDSEIETLINAVHGNVSIPQRAGKAYGEYKTDVSQWVIGYITGREIESATVIESDKTNKEQTGFLGKTLKVNNVNPSTAWAAKCIDKTITYEREKYKVERPVGFTGWPTLDPLSHPTENSISNEDTAVIDISKITLSDAPAGIFASYHAYPYFPNFINEQPEYAKTSDEFGINNYLGYIKELRKYYGEMPLLISEYGVPSSWGNAHYAPSGMNHGGHTQVAQGVYNGRMIKNIFDAGCAGGILFAWQDEWWKKCWITINLAFPYDRYALWHDLTNPEQNFGLIEFQIKEPVMRELDIKRNIITNGTITIDKIMAERNNEFVFVDIYMKEMMTPYKKIVIGFDTYGDALGESLLPNGVKSTVYSELALEINGTVDAQLYVAKDYDLYELNKRVYESKKSDRGEWNKVQWINTGTHESNDKQYVYPEKASDIGHFEIKYKGFNETSNDAVVIDKNIIHIKIPWILLQFRDPTALLVMDNFRNTITDGIRMVVSDGVDGVVCDKLKWEASNMLPEYEERKKESYAIFAEKQKLIPDYIENGVKK